MDDARFWEYKSITLGSSFCQPKDEKVEAILNGLGLEAWEMVSLVTNANTNELRAILKRPLTSQAAAVRKQMARLQQHRPAQKPGLRRLRPDPSE